MILYRFFNSLRLFCLALLVFLLSSLAAQFVQIKDVARWNKTVENPLVGYGLVVGLNRTGDTLIVKSTNQTITNMLKNFGVFVSSDQIRMRNVAAVMVTAKLPSFAHAGERVDVMVSSVGDASSLEGGTLLLTPLFAADGEIYIEAQGPLSLGGYNQGLGGGEKVKKNHPNAGWVPGGGVVVKKAPQSKVSTRMTLALSQTDFSISSAIVAAINARFGEDTAETLNGKEVKIHIPKEFRAKKVAFMADVETLRVAIPPSSKVVVNEKTGTVIIGGNVRISPVAIAHGNLQVTVKTKPVVSQPLPFSKGKTKVLPKSKVKVKEEKSKVLVMNETATIQDLATALNTLGVTPRDLIAILQGLKKAGALQAELLIW